MSQENVEIVRSFYEAHAQGADPCVEYWTDDLEYIDVGIPGQTVRGKDAFRAYLQDWIDTFEDFFIEPLELIDAGEEEVVVVERYGGLARLSGIEMNATNGLVYTIRDGKIARGREYMTPEEALEAAGLSE